jgi:hypothetical protein
MSLNSDPTSCFFINLPNTCACQYRAKILQGISAQERIPAMKRGANLHHQQASMRPAGRILLSLSFQSLRMRNNHLRTTACKVIIQADASDRCFSHELLELNLASFDSMTK